MSYNKSYASWFQGTNNIPQGSGYAANVSLRNDGKTELRGDTYLTNSGKIIIGKDKNTTTNYDIDCQNDVNINGSLNVKNIKYAGEFVLGNLTGSNSVTSLTIGSQSPYNEYVLNNATGLAIVNIWARRLGIVNIGSASLNNNMDINLNAGQSKIQIGNGASGANGVIHIGSTTSGYTNTVNICNNSAIANILNIGSAVSNINIQGQMICNTYVPTTTITNFNNTNFITKLYADSIYQTINGLNGYGYLTSASASNLYQPLANMSLYQLVAGMSLYLTTATASTTYQPITNMALYQLVSGMSNYLTTATASSTYGQLTDLITAQTNITNIQSQLTNIPTLTGYNNYTATGGNNFYYFPYVNTSFQIYPSSDNQLCNKRYVDTFYLSQSNAISLYCSKLYGNTIAGTNVFDGEIVFNNSITLNANIIANSATITPTILSYLSGATSNVQYQIDMLSMYANTNFAVTAFTDRPNIFNHANTLNGITFLNNRFQIDTISVSKYQVSYLANVSSDIQTQLNDKPSNTTLSNYALINQPIISSPQFRSTTQSAGGRICGFQTLNGDSRFNMFDENYGGIQPAQIHTQAGYGLGINAQYGTVKIYQNSVIISEFTSTGENTMNLTVNNKTKILTNTSTVITAATTLTYPLNEFYSVAPNAAIIITLPVITTANIGARVSFRRTGGTATSVITFTVTSPQFVYNSVNSSTCTLASSVYIINFVALYITSTFFGWFQC